VWARLHPGNRGADAIDLRLHAQRLDGRERRLHAAAYDELPDGAYVMAEGAPWLVWGEGLLRWSASGYHHRASRPRRGQAKLLTPPSLVELLRDGWQGLVPLAHPSHRLAGCGTLSQ
jgi:hypothetical protein